MQEARESQPEMPRQNNQEAARKTARRSEGNSTDAQAIMHHESGPMQD